METSRGAEVNQEKADMLEAVKDPTKLDMVAVRLQKPAMTKPMVRVEQQVVRKSLAVPLPLMKSMTLSATVPGWCCDMI